MTKTGARSRPTIMLLAILTIFILSGAQTWGSDGGAGFVSDELLVQGKAGVPKEEIAEIIHAEGAAVVSEIPQIRVKRIKVPAHALDQVKEALSHNPHINFVENNYFAEGAVTPNDYYYPSQWHLPKISAPLGWDIGEGAGNVAIAIIDSGVDPTHPDLSSKLLSGFNFLGSNSDTHDVLGHGTAVAGTAAAITDNYTGVAGVAWANPIMPLVVLDSTNWATYSNISQAITYAADRRVKVINISIGGSSSSSTLQNAVNYAWNKGVIIFASAMNNASNTPYYPAACNNVVAVSATTSSDTRASFSNYGNWVTLSAPGQSILTTTNGGGYGSWSGTSFASPIAAGVAALIISVNPSLTNVQVLDILKKNADDLGTPGFDPYFGYGRVNAYQSLLAAQNNAPQPDTVPPSVSIASPANGSTLSGGVTVNVPATDNVGVSKVNLMINGALYLSDSSTPYNFYWDTSKIGNGAYTLQALAYDGSGNVGQSNIIQVYVNNQVYVDNPVDTVPPTVSLTLVGGNSTSGGIYYVSKKLTISAAASDNVAVQRIEIYIDGALKAASSDSTLRYIWNTNPASKGAHTIMAEAYDLAGNSTTRSITVYK